MGSGVKLDSFGHIGIVVKDCEATAERWSSLLGIGPWTIRDNPGGNLKIGHAAFGPVRFQLLEPLEENISENDPPARRMWLDFLNTKGEGLQHIAAYVDDVDAAAKKLEAEGGNIIFLAPGREAYVEIGGPGSVILELNVKRP